MRYLTEGKKFGDILVVGLNSDASARCLKGPRRPIVPEAERKEMLLALKPVDYVLVFEEDTPLSLMKKIKPHVFIKGGDWSLEGLSALGIVEAMGGGRIEILPKIEDSSTTKIINNIVLRMLEEEK